MASAPLLSREADREGLVAYLESACPALASLLATNVHGLPKLQRLILSENSICDEGVQELRFFKSKLLAMAWQKEGRGSRRP